MWTRLLALLMLPLIAADCLVASVLVRSARNTVSAVAWMRRDRHGWSTAVLWINWAASCPAIGHVDHCRVQAERESRHGSVWAAWARTFRGMPV